MSAPTGPGPRTDASCVVCPSVDSFDGQRWRYETTLGGSALISGASQLAAGAGRKVRFSPLWVRLDHGQRLAGEAMHARVRLAEDGIAYVDRCQLALVHRPPGHELVHSSAANWRRIGEPDLDRFWAFASAAARPPVRAQWEGQEIHEALSKADARAAPFALGRDNSYELDFGPIGAPLQAWLLLEGWSFERARAIAASERGAAPELSLRTSAGEWRAARSLPPVRGDRKAMALSLRGLNWASSRYELRLSTGTSRAMWCLERVRLIETSPAPVAVSKLAPARAELDCEDPELAAQARTRGRFTRHGEVTPLVLDSDEHLVVMRQGDALTLEFANLPPSPPGLETSAFLGVELAYKPCIPVGASAPSLLTEQVDPLPRRFMGRYGLDARPHAHRQFLDYIEDWNTRTFS